MRKIFLGVLLILCCGSALAVVDLNTASQKELQAVPGITAAKAKAIVRYREKHGAFTSVDDLRHVKGFNKASIKKVQPELVAGDPPSSQISRGGNAKPRKHSP